MADEKVDEVANEDPEAVAGADAESNTDAMPAIETGDIDVPTTSDAPVSDEKTPAENVEPPPTDGEGETEPKKGDVLEEDENAA